jgi:hypothetical protein
MNARRAEHRVSGGGVSECAGARSGSTYYELNHQRALGRPLYLELRVLGSVREEEDDDT